MPVGWQCLTSNLLLYVEPEAKGESPWGLRATFLVGSQMTLPSI